MELKTILLLSTIAVAAAFPEQVLAEQPCISDTGAEVKSGDCSPLGGYRCRNGTWDKVTTCLRTDSKPVLSVHARKKADAGGATAAKPVEAAKKAGPAPAKAVPAAQGGSAGQGT